MLNIKDKNIMLAGDWHGHTDEAFKVVKAAAEQNLKTIIQVGDFGIWQGTSGERFLHKVERILSQNNITCYFVDGNHENFDILYSGKYSIGANGLRKITDHIYHLPRGYVFTWDGLNVLALGGAYSIDSGSRTPGKSWWAEEAIADSEVRDAIKSIEKVGKIDLMITHDSPLSVPNVVTDDHVSQLHAALTFGNSAIELAQEHRKVLDNVYHRAQPSLIVHGHYHSFFHKPAPYGMVLSLDEGGKSLREHTTVLSASDVKNSKNYATLK